MCNCDVMPFSLHLGSLNPKPCIFAAKVRWLTVSQNLSKMKVLSDRPLTTLGPAVLGKMVPPHFPQAFYLCVNNVCYVSVSTYSMCVCMTVCVCVSVLLFITVQDILAHALSRCLVSLSLLMSRLPPLNPPTPQVFRSIVLWLSLSLYLSFSLTHSVWGHI